MKKITFLSYPNILMAILFIFLFFSISGTKTAQAQQQDKVSKAVEIVKAFCVTGGSRVELKSEINGGISLRKLAGGSGKVSFDYSELEGLADAFNEVSAGQASEMRECMKPYIQQILNILLNTPEPSQSKLKKIAETWHNCGAGQLPGDNIVDVRIMSVHKRSIYIEVDYAYNSRHLAEKPIYINAYLLGEINGKETGLAGKTFSEEVKQSVGSVSFQVEVSEKNIPVKSHDLFVYMTGIYIPEGRPKTQTPPFVCQRMPFNHNWN